MPAANTESKILTVKQTVSTDTVRNYLVEIGRVPLLTSEEELFYGRQVQEMMHLLATKDELEQKLGQPPLHSVWADAVKVTVSHLEAALHEGQYARKKMMEANLRLVVAIAKKYQHHNLEFSDLIQEGTLGLERAVEKFDPSKGYKFSTYAYWWIRQSITRAIDQKSRSIRLPIHVCQTLKKIKKGRRELTQELGRMPTIKDIAAYVELEPKQVQEYLEMMRQPMSLDLRVGESQDTQLQELLEDTSYSLDKYLETESLRQYLKQLLSELTPQQREVVILHFGLSDGRELTLNEVAQQMHIPHARVRQLQRQAIARLRRKKKNIKNFLIS